MIIRLVKLTFSPEKVSEFQKLFEEHQQHIRNFPGCLELKLLKVSGSENIFFTYSEWSDHEALEDYRKSEFFNNIWSKAKKAFSDKPQAWSLSTLT